MRKSGEGFTLVEVLVVSAVLGVVVAGAVGVFRTHSYTYTQQELSVARDENLRFAISAIRDELRRARYGAPDDSELSVWLPTSWLSGFTTNPRIIQGSGSAPDRISIAACTAQPVAFVAGGGASGNTIALTPSAAGVDANLRRLVRVGDDGFAWVRAVVGNTITVDTDPSNSASGNQPLSRTYPEGTPVCRVDVVTFDVQSGALRRNLNQGAGPEEMAQGIINLQITMPAADRYQIVLTAETEHSSPGAGSRITRSLASSITLMNGA